MQPIFDRKLLNAHRDRAARMPAPDADFLWQECAERLIEKLSDITRRFPMTLDLGSHHGKLRNLLQGRFGIETIIQTESSEAMLHLTSSPKIRMNEEWLAFKSESFHLVISLNSLQWINDLPGTLKQIFRILKPDGLFIAMIPGGETLIELKNAFYEAMETTTGGITPRFSPMVDVPDAGSLLQRAGFALPVVDREQIMVSYSHPLKLLRDLRAMGQTNALLARPHPLTRSTLIAMSKIYTAKFPDSEGNIRATFDLLTATGWKPF